MLTFLFAVVIGILVGWNVPQPDFIKVIKDKVLSVFKKFLVGWNVPQPDFIKVIKDKVLSVFKK